MHARLRGDGWQIGMLRPGPRRDPSVGLTCESLADKVRIQCLLVVGLHCLPRSGGRMSPRLDSWEKDGDDGDCGKH